MTDLVHDCAFMAATALTEMTESKLKPGENKEEFHKEAYEVFKAGLEAFIIQGNRARMRYEPSRN